jgi:hypothetical protein
VLQEGRRVGVPVTATTARRTGVPSAVQAAFGARLVLRMTVAEVQVAKVRSAPPASGVARSAGTAVQMSGEDVRDGQHGLRFASSLSPLIEAGCSASDGSIESAAITFAVTTVLC